MTESQLKKKTKAQLLELAGAEGVSGVSAANTKAEIIAALLAHFAAAAENNPAENNNDAGETAPETPAPKRPKFDEAALASAVASASAAAIDNPFMWVARNVAQHIGGQGFKLHERNPDGSFVLEMTGPDITGSYVVT